MKKILVCLTVLALLLSGCASKKQEDDGTETQIVLSDSGITVDGKKICDDTSKAVYSARDIVFYPAGQDFTYGEGTDADAHEQSEADAHTVVHITKPGRYVLSGKLSLGQIAVDLGEEAESDPDAVVTLVLNNVDVTCTVAPAIIFYNVYECASKDGESATMSVDTKGAGANVIIADGSENNVSGSYVAKIYESYELSEDGTEIADSKKLHKYDGAFYSKQSINVNGEEKGTGILNINAENEGLDSELHLTINGGTVNITSGNDGINTNEDNVSVTTVNGGTLNILCDGSTGEGDGIDSNGWLVINGGSVTSQACSTSGDAGIDSDKGIYINGGRVVASGNMLDRIAGKNQTYAVFSFAQPQDKGGTYTLKSSSGKVVAEYTLNNTFTYLIVAGDELTPDDYTFWQGDTQLKGVQTKDMQGTMPQGGMPGSQGDLNGQGEAPTPPEGMERPGLSDKEPPEKPEGEFPKGERPEMPEGEMPEMPEGMTPPDIPEGMMGGTVTPGQPSEASETFTIVKGENQFFNVSPITP